MSEVLLRAPFDSSTPDSEELAPAKAPGLTKSPRVRHRRSIFVILSTGWLGLVILAVILEPILPVKDYTKSDYKAIAAPLFSPGHILGTDEIGRDILARLIVGGRISLIVGFGAIAIATVIGSFIGIVAGFFGGIVDRIISGIIDIMLAFPALIALISLSVFLGASLRTIIIGIGIVGSPQLARVARASTITFANRDFVTAARGTGASSWRVLRREMLPNVVVPILSYSLIFVAVAIIAEGGLSFLGLGVPPPASSWGSMMGSGQNELATHPHIVLVPAAAMFLTLLSLNFLGDHLGKRFDIRESLL